MTPGELAERYGTPLYVYDLDEAAAARDDLTASLPASASLYYALKANPHPGVARALREGTGRPCRAEISSEGELAAALAAGYAGGDCLYTGPGKTDAELAAALAAGVRTFSAESPGDLRRIGRAATVHGVTADCLLRVNGAPAGAPSGIAMAGRPSQFGFDAEALPEALAELSAVPGARLAGAHFFPLSNAADEDTLISEFEHTIATAARLRARHGLPLRLLDLGGGFAAPYGVAGPRPSYGGLRGALEKALDRDLPGWRRGEPEIAFESGRHLVARCGTLLVSVTDVKRSRGRVFAVLDAGVNAFGGMAGLGRLLPPDITPGRAGGAPPGGAVAEPVTLAGPLCTPGDVLARNADLVPPAAGDVLAVPNAGAYGVTASPLAFLGRPAPREVTLRDGAVVSVSRLEPHREWSTP